MEKKNMKRLMAYALVAALTTQSPITVKASEKTSDVKISEVNYVMALSNVNIRKYPSTESEKLGLLKTGEALKLNFETSDGWYRVKYNDVYGYISKDYAEIVERKEVVGDKTQAIVLEDTKLYTDIGPLDIKKYTIGEVTEVNDIYYYIKTDKEEGYVAKDKSDILTDTYVIVDISDQELNLFNKGELILTTPVVTGTPTKSRETHMGYFEIYDKSHDRYLVGPNYRSYVDKMMKFNNNEGLHDAEYHKDYDENGKLIKSHGWREISEFGGQTYQHNGSHGCVNMPHDAAVEVYNNTDVGSRVLVKE